MKLRYIDEINKKDRRKKVILIGKGPSIDSLDVKALKKQDEYDILCISDALKVVKNKFSVHFHPASLLRSIGQLKNTEKFLISTNIFKKLKGREFVDKMIKNHNVYFFESRTVKAHIIQEGNFDIDVKRFLFNSSGSVVGAINFLFGYMGYEEIKYIGFDGGRQYGESVKHGRKAWKVVASADKYALSWQSALDMVEHYPDKKFLPLDKFLKGLK